MRLLALFVALLAGDVGGQLALGWTRRHAPLRVVDGAALGAALVLAAAMLAIYTALVHALEQRPASEASPRAAQALMGAVLGLVLFASVIGLLHLAGSAHLVGISAGFDPIPALAISIIAAVGEELALRGAAFRILEETCGTSLALMLSAAIFGLLHVLNPGATAVSTAAIAIEAGVLLGVAYVLTRNLWLPIGIHFGWNFTEGGVFGTAVSGGAAGKGMLAMTLSGPKFLTGGSFGPEASVIAVAVGLGAALVLAAVSVRRGRWKRAPWRLRPA